MFFKVTDPEPDVCPTCTFPKPRLVADKVKSGTLGATPVPVSVMLCVLPDLFESLSVAVSFADSVFSVDGVKFTEIWQDAPMASWFPQLLLVILKSLGPALEPGVIEMPVMVRSAVPTFSNVSISAVLVVLMTVFGNLRLPVLK